MTPRPIYRWKAFWLGLFVTCFLAWAWWDSLNFSSSGMWHQTHFNSGIGEITLARQTSYSVKPAWTRSILRRSSAYQPPSLFEAPLFLRGGGKNTIPNDPPPTLREAYVIGMAIAPRTNWLLIIPYWLILSAFSLAWSAFLLWRRWKMKHLTRTASNNPSPV